MVDLHSVKSHRKLFLLSFLAGVFLLASCDIAPEVEETAPPERGEELYFPPDSGEWDRIDPALAGWDAEALEAVLHYAGQQRSSGVVILLNGRILTERYWEVVETPPDVIDYSGLIAGKNPTLRHRVVFPGVGGPL